MNTKPPRKWPDATRAAILRECVRADRGTFTLDDLYGELPEIVSRTCSRAKDPKGALRATLSQLCKREEILVLGDVGDGCYRLTQGFQFPGYWRAPPPGDESAFHDPRKWALL